MLGAGRASAREATGMADIEIVVNGEKRVWPGPVRLLDLLAALRVEPRGVAVERNGQVVSRAALEATLVGDGDRLEIIRMVGGG
jgi:thiamine biosynthesis protein ThiS